MPRKKRIEHISKKEKLSFLLGQESEDIDKLKKDTLDSSLFKDNTNLTIKDIENLVTSEDRYKTVFLSPNDMTKKQVNLIPGIDQTVVDQVINGAPYYSMKELSTATKVPETILNEIFKIEPYQYKDKTTNRAISLEPVYGHYIIPSSVESEFEALERDTDYYKVVPSSASFEFNVIKLKTDFESVKNLPHLLKDKLGGKVYPVLSDNQGYKRIFVPSSIDIWFNSEVASDQIQYIIDKFKLHIVKSIPKVGYYKVTFSIQKNHIDIVRKTFEIINELQTFDEVLFAEPDQVGFDDFEESIEESREIDFETLNKFWFYYDTQMNFVHENYTKGSKDVVIFVVDTGCRMDHTELKDKFRNDWRTLDLDFEYDSTINETSPNQTKISHGTMVSGVVAKIAPKCKIIPLKVGAWYGGRAAAIRSALSYCVAEKRAVINLSWKTDGEHIGIREALKDAQKQNIAVVTSAGNYGRQMGNEVHYPSGYVWLEPILDNLCSVGATSASHRRSSYSYFGDKSVTLAAPGGEFGGKGTAIYSTSISSDISYDYSAGTSFSAPHVAGLIALLFSKNINLSAKEAIEILKDTADPINDEVNNILGAGSINAAEALKRVESTVLEIDENELSHYNDLKKLNINLATFEELLKVPYLGFYLSNEIIEYRERNGFFSNIWQLNDLYIQTWFIQYLSDYIYCE